MSKEVSKMVTKLVDSGDVDPSILATAILTGHKKAKKTGSTTVEVGEYLIKVKYINEATSCITNILERVE